MFFSCLPPARVASAAFVLDALFVFSCPKDKGQALVHALHGRKTRRGSGEGCESPREKSSERARGEEKKRNHGGRCPLRLRTCFSPPIASLRLKSRVRREEASLIQSRGLRERERKRAQRKKKQAEIGKEREATSGESCSLDHFCDFAALFGRWRRKKKKERKKEQL